MGPADLSPKTRAPQLPTCATLSPSGSLVSPLVATNGDFPDYDDLPYIVRTGGDNFGWAASISSAAAQGPPDPNSVVRALLWHRLWHEEPGDFHGSDSEEATSMLYASTTKLSRQRYCAVAGRGINPDFRPRTGCDGVLNPPSIRYPYCESLPHAAVTKTKHRKHGKHGKL